jgi:hypothetical protein
MKKWIDRFRCWYRGHAWTCAAAQGKKPTPEQLKSIEGFNDYATMYCGRCGKVSPLSYRYRLKNPHVKH